MHSDVVAKCASCAGETPWRARSWERPKDARRRRHAASEGVGEDRRLHGGVKAHSARERVSRASRVCERHGCYPAAESTPTGNGTRLGIAWHALAGRARHLLPRTACRSLRLPSFGPQPTSEPSSEPWLECRPRGPFEPFSCGEPPKRTRLIWYISLHLFYCPKRAA